MVGTSDYDKLHPCFVGGSLKFTGLHLDHFTVDILDFDTESVSSFTFSDQVISYSPSPDCTTGFVSHSESISVFPLSGSQSDIDTFPITLDTNEVSLGHLLAVSNVLVYALPGEGINSWDTPPMRCINIEDSSLTLKTASLNSRANAQGFLHRNGKDIYMPASFDIFKLQVDEDCNLYQYQIREDLYTQEVLFTIDEQYLMDDGGTLKATTDQSDNDLKMISAFNSSEQGFPRRETFTSLTQEDVYPYRIVGVYREPLGFSDYTEKVVAMSFPYLNSLGTEMDIPSAGLQQETSIHPRQVFTVPGNTDGIFVFSDYDFETNTLIGIAWVQHDFPEEPTIPLPDPGKVIQNEGETVWLFRSYDESYPPEVLKNFDVKVCWMGDEPYFLVLDYMSLHFLSATDHSVIFSFPLVRPGVALALQDLACRNVVVAHQSYITLIDLENYMNTSPQVFHTGYGGVESILYSSNGIVYLFPSFDQWSRITCLNSQTGEVTESPTTIYAGSTAFMSPGDQYIYKFTQGVSPQSMDKFLITDSCLSLNMEERSEPWGSARYGWFSWDETRILLDSGKVMSPYDLKVKGSIYDAQHPNPRPFVWYAPHPTEPHNIFSLRNDQEYITIYSWPILEEMGIELIPSPGECATSHPYQLHFSQDGATMYTYAAYDINGEAYHGIGVKKSISVHDRETFELKSKRRESICPPQEKSTSLFESLFDEYVTTASYINED